MRTLGAMLAAAGLLLIAGCGEPSASGEADARLAREDARAQAAAAKQADQVMRDARLDALEARMARLEESFERTGRSLDADRLDTVEAGLAELRGRLAEAQDNTDGGASPATKSGTAKPSSANETKPRAAKK